MNRFFMATLHIPLLGYSLSLFGGDSSLLYSFI
jgi:hypothetical protein